MSKHGCYLASEQGKPLWPPPHPPSQTPRANFCIVTRAKRINFQKKSSTENALNEIRKASHSFYSFSNQFIFTLTKRVHHELETDEMAGCCCKQFSFSAFKSRFSKNVLKRQKTAPAEEEEDNQAQPVSIFFLDLFERRRRKKGSTPGSKDSLEKEKKSRKKSDHAETACSSMGERRRPCIQVE